MPDVDVVVPTITGREDSLARCLESYERHTDADALNLIVVKDEPTVGLAWLEGISRSTAPYIHLSCDDLEMTSWIWLEVCKQVADAGQLPCPVVKRPNGSIESCGGDMNSPACLISDMQEDRTEVDFTVVPFGSREQVEAIGMVPSHYLSDTYFSHKGRRLGYPTVVAHGYEFIHHHEMTGRLGHGPSDQRIYDEAMGNG